MALGSLMRFYLPSVGAYTDFHFALRCSDARLVSFPWLYQAKSEGLTKCSRG